jgi:hypothetical protein
MLVKDVVDVASGYGTVVASYEGVRLVRVTALQRAGVPAVECYRTHSTSP